MVNSFFAVTAVLFHSVLPMSVLLTVLRSFSGSIAVGWEMFCVKIELLKSFRLKTSFWAQLLANIWNTCSMPLPASPLNYRGAVVLQNWTHSD